MLFELMLELLVLLLFLLFKFGVEFGLESLLIQLALVLHQLSLLHLAEDERRAFNWHTSIRASAEIKKIRHIGSLELSINDRETKQIFTPELFTLAFDSCVWQ